MRSGGSAVPNRDPAQLRASSTKNFSCAANRSGSLPESTDIMPDDADERVFALVCTCTLVERVIDTCPTNWCLDFLPER